MHICECLLAICIVPFRAFLLTFNSISPVSHFFAYNLAVLCMVILCLTQKGSIINCNEVGLVCVNSNCLVVGDCPQLWRKCLGLKECKC